MSDDIQLEDGRTWSGSSSLVSWICRLTACELTGAFGRWLNDVKDRPNGLCSFDLRGLSNDDCDVFYSATARALERARQSGDYPDAASYFERWEVLLRMRESIRRGEPPNTLTHYAIVVPFDGKPIDFNDIWFCPECSTCLNQKKSCDACGFRLFSNDEGPDAWNDHG